MSECTRKFNEFWAELTKDWVAVDNRMRAKFEQERQQAWAIWYKAWHAGKASAATASGEREARES